MINKELKIILLTGALLTLSASVASLYFSKVCSIICLALGIMLTLVFYLCTKKRLNSINQLNDYLSLVCSGNYDMEIGENTEGEISILRNNLLKVVVLLKTQNEELKKDKIFLSESLADITHQLKTPLTSMTVMSDLLKNEQEREKQAEFFEIMDSQLTKMNSLIRNLLKISKLDSGTVRMNREEIGVLHLVEQSLNPFVPELARKNISVHQSIGNDIILCDEFWTIEALQNIIKNAIEHTDDDGIISISLSCTPLYDELKINDNGCGISDDDKMHIFERFYSCNNSSSDCIGIGLALSKTILEKQRATIEVQSEVGKGTSFIIKFYKTIV